MCPPRRRDSLQDGYLIRGEGTTRRRSEPCELLLCLVPGGDGGPGATHFLEHIRGFLGKGPRIEYMGNLKFWPAPRKAGLHQK